MLEDVNNKSTRLRMNFIVNDMTDMKLKFPDVEFDIHIDFVNIFYLPCLRTTAAAIVQLSLAHKLSIPLNCYFRRASFL